MLNQRTYHNKSKYYQDAITELKEGAGSQFDPEMVKVFLEVIDAEA